eukprot:scaffold181945_cov40-Tisochrysis_lutea.AAC.1
MAPPGHGACGASAEGPGEHAGTRPKTLAHTRPSWSTAARSTETETRSGREGHAGRSGDGSE